MKPTLTLIWMLLLATSLSSQTFIEKPAIGGSNVPYSEIQSIELNDSATIINFKTTYFPGWWIRIRKGETFIQSSDGGEALYVKQAEGLILDTEHWTPESGVNYYSLFFPPLENHVSSIDFIGERWRIYDIQLSDGSKISSNIPDWMTGNWLSTDGNNQWEYGFFDNHIFYENKIWNNFKVQERNGKLVVLLFDDQRDMELYVQKADDSSLKIGTTPNNQQQYRKEQTLVKGRVISENQPYREPVFNEDVAVYQGYINGYHPKMGETGIAYVDNLLTGDQESRVVVIKPDGTFKTEIPLLHPQSIFLRLLNMNEQVFLEPGKTLTHFINLDEYNSAYKNHDDFMQRDRQSLFMGDLAKTNVDLALMSPIRYVDYNALREMVVEMTPEEYHEYYMEAMASEIVDLQKLKESVNLCAKALQIKQLEIPMRIVSGLLEYNRMKESAYRQQHNIPWEQRDIDFEDHVFQPADFEFLKDYQLNSELSLLTGSTYSTFINRIQYYRGLDELIESSDRRTMMYLLEVLNNANVDLSEEELSLVNKIMDCFSDDCLNEVIQTDFLIWEPFFSKNHEYVQKSVEQFSMNQQRIQRNKIIEKMFGFSDGLFADLSLSQRQSQIMKSAMKPLTSLDKERVRNEVQNAFILDNILAQSDLLSKEIEETKLANINRTGYVVNKTPEGRGEDLFEAIIEKYRGKLVYVDFWATWCGPCRSGMERIKPLKEELKDEDVVFVYITNPSSPQNTWELMIPDVKGEHFRVSQDEWNYFASMFNISGIPHYLLVDRDGKVVRNNLYMDNESLKKLFNEYL